MNAAEHPEHWNRSLYILISKLLLHLSLFISLNISVEVSIKPVLHKDSLMCIFRIGAIENNRNHNIIFNYTLLYE